VVFWVAGFGLTNWHISSKSSFDSDAANALSAEAVIGCTAHRHISRKYFYMSREYALCRGLCQVPAGVDFWTQFGLMRLS
jgi:hypothetical protein